MSFWVYPKRSLAFDSRVFAQNPLNGKIAYENPDAIAKWPGYKWMGEISWYQAGCHIPAITTNRGAAIHPLMMQVSCEMVLGSLGTGNAGLSGQVPIWLTLAHVALTSLPNDANNHSEIDKHWLR